MSIFKEINALKKEISKLESQLAKVRARINRTQDKILKDALKEEASSIIDDIDRARAKLAEKEAELPASRTNGYHPPESEEEEKWDPDFYPDEDDEREN